MNYVMIWAFRLFVAALLAFGIAYAFRREWKYEQQVALTGCTSRDSSARSTVIWLTPWSLPIVVAVLWLITLIYAGPAVGAAVLTEFSLQLMVLLTFYFGALMLLLPLLRRKISARACATLWLLPVFLYYNLTVWRNSYLPPLVVLRVPSGVVPMLLGLWAAGFVAVVLWHMFSHFRFRRALLRDARPVEEPDVVNLWGEEQRQVLLKRHIPLLTSPATTSPLTIGLFHSTMCLVLPERAYTLDQYRLIFRHELRHVQRRDADTKCFYILCKALCWFNPLVWIALKKAAADLELSCDEMVVYGADNQTRRAYASLLLESAGDDRGLSTCLSASASSLRHRLRGVVSPGEHTSGTKLLALMMAILVLCSGLVGVSGSYGTLGEVALASYGPDHRVSSVSIDGKTRYHSQRDMDPQTSGALLDYLSALPVTKLATGQTVSDSEGSHLTAFVAAGDAYLFLNLTDQLCSVQDVNSDQISAVLCRVDGPVDWDYLGSLLE